MKHWLAILFLLLAGTLAAQDAIGKVIAVEGSVTISQGGGGQSSLEVGSPIYLHETIEVGSNARVQIQLLDGSLVNLIPDSEYVVDNFSYGHFFRTNRCRSELLKGGLRLLSGEIGETSPDNYQVVTPTATIGLRGTSVYVLYEPALHESYIGVSSGSVFVRGPQGNVTVGAGQSAAAGRLGPPQHVAPMPAAMRTRLFAPPPGARNMTTPERRQYRQGPRHNAPRTTPAHPRTGPHVGPHGKPRVGPPGAPRGKPRVGPHAGPHAAPGPATPAKPVHPKGITPQGPTEHPLERHTTPSTTPHR